MSNETTKVNFYQVLTLEAYLNLPLKDANGLYFILEDAKNRIYLGNKLYSSGVNVDWAIVDVDDPAFIYNKPVTITSNERSKLLNIEDGAEVNNISDVNALDLTDGESSSLHYHTSDRDRANHTGTQLASTISNFDTAISSNTSVQNNTTHRASDGKDHSDVVLSNTHRLETISDDPHNISESLMTQIENRKCILISDGVDLDTITDGGLYNGASLLNSPPELDGVREWCYVHVLRHSNSSSYLTQVAYSLQRHRRSWIRSKTGGAWSDWTEYITANNIANFTDTLTDNGDGTVTLVGATYDRVLGSIRWTDDSISGLSLKGRMDAYGGAFQIEIIVDFQTKPTFDVLNLFPALLDGCLVRYEVAENFLLTDRTEPLGGFTYTIKSFEYVGSDWTSSSAEWGNEKGNGTAHENQVDDTETYITGTSKLILSETATMTMNWSPTYDPVGTKASIMITGFIKGFGEI